MFNMVIMVFSSVKEKEEPILNCMYTCVFVPESIGMMT